MLWLCLARPLPPARRAPRRHARRAARHPPVAARRWVFQHRAMAPRASPHTCGVRLAAEGAGGGWRLFVGEMVDCAEVSTAAGEGLAMAGLEGGHS